MMNSGTRCDMPLNTLFLARISSHSVRVRETSRITQWLMMYFVTTCATLASNNMPTITANAVSGLATGSRKGTFRSNPKSNM